MKRDRKKGGRRVNAEWRKEETGRGSIERGTGKENGGYGEREMQRWEEKEDKRWYGKRWEVRREGWDSEEGKGEEKTGMEKHTERGRGEN